MEQIFLPQWAISYRALEEKRHSVMKQSKSGSGVLLQGWYLLSAFHILSLWSLLSCKPVCQAAFELYSSSPLPPPLNFIWIPLGARDACNQSV